MTSHLKGATVTRLLTVRRSLAAAAITPLALTGLVACGDNSGSDTAADPAASSSATSTPSPSEDATAPAVEAGSTLTPADFTDLLKASLESITTAHTTLSSGGGLIGTLKGEGDVDYSADSPEVMMTMSADEMGGEMEMRLVDGVMYMKIGSMTGGKYWKIDLNSPDNPFGSLGVQLDPKASMEMFGKGLTSAKYIGQEEVDGETLDHYQATLDPQAVLASMGGPAASAGSSGLPDSYDYDIWLDDQGRFTKLTLGMGKAGSMEMSLTDFGKDVSIEAPPADQVMKMPAMPTLPEQPSA